MKNDQGRVGSLRIDLQEQGVLPSNRDTQEIRLLRHGTNDVFWKRADPIHTVKPGPDHAPLYAFSAVSPDKKFVDAMQPPHSSIYCQILE